jgi:hypothetical protein
MKYFIVLLLVLMTASSKAQITPEHTYNTANYQRAIVQVDSGVSRYVLYNGYDSVSIYNLDHSLDRVIQLPVKQDDSTFNLLGQISRRLFDPDEGYECLIITGGYRQPSITIYRENGEIIFGCVSCQLTRNDAGTYGINAATGSLAAITNTEHGAKMMVDYYNGNYVFQTVIFSLPGKLPGSAVRLGVVEPPSVVSGNNFPTSAYPNPSNGQMRISYSLLSGETTGELVIISTDGVEVKRYKVGEGFNDILVEKSDLSSGSYFYKLVTEKGESEVKRLVILK